MLPISEQHYYQLKKKQFMIEIGKTQILTVYNKTDFGFYLDAKTQNRKENILLPLNQADDSIDVGSEIKVFVYRDSEDRLIATRKKPLAELGQMAKMRVKEVTPIGAFLDWGLEKDLFMPFREQKYNVEVGMSYLVAVYLDKSKRLCATSNIYDYLSSDSPFHEGDHVTGTVYKVNPEIGIFVAVDNQYFGLIPKSESFSTYKEGMEISARVIRVREDGKLDLSSREIMSEQIDSDAKLLIQKLKANKGFLPLNDDSTPESIKERLSMSKKAFKRAVGNLLKNGIVQFYDNGIRLK